MLFHKQNSQFVFQIEYFSPSLGEKRDKDSSDVLGPQLLECNLSFRDGDNYTYK